jgi:hypothetical protein
MDDRRVFTNVEVSPARLSAPASLLALFSLALSAEKLAFPKDYCHPIQPTPGLNMMEETSSEWGQVIVLDAPAPSFPPNPLLKVFLPSAGLSATAPAQSNHSGGQPDCPQQALALLPRAQSFLLRARDKQQALTPLYSHPRYVEHPSPPTPSSLPQTRRFSLLLLTAISTFTACYVYRLTGQKLELQTQVKNYLETLSYEKQARSALISPNIKIITLPGNVAGEVTAKIFWDTKSNACLVYLYHLPQAAPDQYFQLWFLTSEGKFVKAKSFRGENGSAELSLQLPAEEQVKREFLLLSLERSRHIAFPEGQILVKGLLR